VVVLRRSVYDLNITVVVLRRSVSDLNITVVVLRRSLSYREDVQHINTNFKVHVQEQNIFPNLHPVYLNILERCHNPAWILLKILNRLRTF
jgi:hypothetical protein